MAPDVKEAAMLAIVDRAARIAPRELVLRGGLVMRELIAPLRRPVDDVDFLALCNEAEGRTRLRMLGSERSGDFEFALGPIERTWEETEFPGLRTQCTATGLGGEVIVQLDVGFGDPRAVPERALKLPGAQHEITAVGLETMLAWKIHGMFERGDGAWRAKDLIDVHDLVVRCVDEGAATRCLALAFDSRGDDFSICARFLHAEWGTSRGSRRKWRRFRRQRAEFDATRSFPEDLQELVERLRALVGPLIDAASRG